MSRVAPKITATELEAKIRSKVSDLGELIENQKILKDLGKIQFDFENYAFDESDIGGFTGMLGFKTLDNGFSFLGGAAGGDWESPVYFIVYWDGKKLRGYVPEEGNTFNPKYRTAYGSEMESELYQFEISKLTDAEAEALDEKIQDEAEKSEEAVKEDFAKISEDIKGRIELTT